MNELSRTKIILRLALGIAVLALPIGTFSWWRLANLRPAISEEAAPKTPARIVRPLAFNAYLKTGEVLIRDNVDKRTLRAFCLAPNGNIYAALGGPGEYRSDAPGNGKTWVDEARGGEIRVLAADGKVVAKWLVDFTPQAVAALPGGDLFVAGQGRIARFTPAGERTHFHFLEPIRKLEADPTIAERAIDEMLRTESVINAIGQDGMAGLLEAKRNELEQYQSAIAKTKQSIGDNSSDEDRKLLEKFAKEEEQLRDDLENVEKLSIAAKNGAVMRQKFRAARTREVEIADYIARESKLDCLAVSDEWLFISTPHDIVLRLSHDLTQVRLIDLAKEFRWQDPLSLAVFGQELLVSGRQGTSYRQFSFDGVPQGAAVPLLLNKEYVKDSRRYDLSFMCHFETLDQAGSLVVSNSHGKIELFTHFLKPRQLLYQEELPPERQLPRDIALTVDGKTLYVCDLHGSRLLVLSAVGEAN